MKGLTVIMTIGAGAWGFVLLAALRGTTAFSKVQRLGWYGLVAASVVLYAIVVNAASGVVMQGTPLLDIELMQDPRFLSSIGFIGVLTALTLFLVRPRLPHAPSLLGEIDAVLPSITCECPRCKTSGIFERGEGSCTKLRTHGWIRGDEMKSNAYRPLMSIWFVILSFALLGTWTMLVTWGVIDVVSSMRGISVFAVIPFIFLACAGSRDSARARMTEESAGGTALFGILTMLGLGGVAIVFGSTFMEREMVQIAATAGIVSIIFAFTGLLAQRYARIPHGGMLLLVPRSVTLVTLGTFAAFTGYIAWASFTQNRPADIALMVILISMCLSLACVLMNETIIFMQRRPRDSQESWDASAAITANCPSCTEAVTGCHGVLRCGGCSTRFFLRFEEERCGCGHLLYRVPGPTCPECGAARVSHSEPTRAGVLGGDLPTDQSVHGGVVESTPAQAA